MSTDYNELAKEMLTAKEMATLQLTYPEYRKQELWKALYDFGNFCDEDKWNTSLLVEWIARGVCYILDDDHTVAGFQRPKGSKNGLEDLRKKVEEFLGEQNDEARWMKEDEPENFKKSYYSRCVPGTAFDEATLREIRTWLYETTPWTVYQMYLKVQDAADSLVEEYMLQLSWGEQVDIATHCEKTYNEAMKRWQGRVRLVAEGKRTEV